MENKEYVISRHKVLSGNNMITYINKKFPAYVRKHFNYLFLQNNNY